jgi:hypothetical protein
MHSTTLLTIPKTKDWQLELASHWARHAWAVVMPLGWERGVALPLPEGAEPQVSRTLRGEAEAAPMKAEAAMILVKDCILMVEEMSR